MKLGDFLDEGDIFRILNVLDIFGDPVAEGIWEGGAVSVPVPAGERTGEGEFCAYVVFRDTN